MTNRFKFRAWSKRIEKFIYNIQDVGVDFSIECWEDCFGDFLNNENYIIEQCTDLKDKNGKLIYEGDILAVPYIDPIFMQPVNMEVNSDVAYVELYKGCFVAHYPEKQRKYLYDYENIAEVIGNINENPDLLEN